jgi:ABC-2 type transport system permease protein
MNGLRSTLVIAKREVFSFFASPIAYVVLVVWLVWSGVGFSLFCANYAQSISMGGSDNPLTMFFGNTILFFLPTLAMAPALTMRLFAEEARSGSLEALLTAPVSDVAIVVGKYLAAMLFWCALWAPTVLYVWLTSRYGDVDLGVVSASYLGIFCIGLYYMAIGLFMSIVSPNQIIAFVLTFLVLGLLFVFGIAAFVLPPETRDIVSAFSIWSHMEDFSQGVIDSRYLVYDASVALFALFASVRALANRRLS